MSVLLSLGLASYAQSSSPCYKEVPCPPGMPMPICKEIILCWKVNIINNLNCELTFFAEYAGSAGCGGMVSMDMVLAGETKTVQTYQAEFSGDGCGCLCPSWLRIAEWNVPGYVPWTIQNPNNPQPTPPGAAFNDCNGDPVYVNITYISATEVTIEFHY